MYGMSDTGKGERAREEKKKTSSEDDEEIHKTGTRQEGEKRKLP